MTALGRAVARQHELHLLFRNGAAGHFIERLQQFHGLLGLGFGAVHLELLKAVGNAHLQGRLYGAQVRIGRAAQVREAGVVVGREGVAKNQAVCPEGVGRFCAPRVEIVCPSWGSVCRRSFRVCRRSRCTAKICP